MTNTPSYSDNVYNPVVNITDTNSNNRYDLLVFIGRFQPFHFGHSRVIDIALRKSDKVLVLVGSAFRPRRPRNPWTFTERVSMIRESYPEVPSDKLIFAPLEDYTYRDNVWIKTVQEIVAKQVPKDAKIGLIGCSKDHTSYYLDLFPQWGSVNVEFLNPLNSTDIRKLIFGDSAVRDTENSARPLVPAFVLNYLCQWKNSSPDFADVSAYWNFCETYKAKRQHGSLYPVQDVTVDNIVTCSGHVLLVKRKAHPGKGLWALPGGYLNPTETVVQGALRELREETKINLSDKMLKAYITNQGVFDDPHRSERGRIISHTLRIEIPAGPLPRIKGSDDAEEATWLPLSEISSEKLFEDHYDQLQVLLQGTQNYDYFTLRL